VEDEQPAEVQQTAHAVHLRLGDIELAHEQLKYAGGDRLLNLQPHGWPESPAQQLSLQSLEEVFRLVLVNVEIGVSGHSECMVLDDVHTREQLLQVRGDQVFERQEIVVADRDEAR